MNEAELRALIAGGETASVEFKSDRSPLADGALAPPSSAMQGAPLTS